MSGITLSMLPTHMATTKLLKMKYLVYSKRQRIALSPSSKKKRKVVGEQTKRKLTALTTWLVMTKRKQPKPTVTVDTRLSIIFELKPWQSVRQQPTSESDLEPLRKH